MAPVALPHCPSVRSLQSLFLWVWAVRRRLLRTLCLFALLPIHFEFPPPLHRSVHCAALCCMSGTVPTFSDFCFASLHSLFLRALPRCLLRTLCLFAFVAIHLQYPPPPRHSVHCAALCCLSGTVPTFSHFCFVSLHSLFLRGPATLSVAYIMPFCISSNTFRISSPRPPFCALCCFLQHERHSAHIHRILHCFSPLTLSVGPATLSIAYVMQYISNCPPLPTVRCTVLLCAA